MKANAIIAAIAAMLVLPCACAAKELTLDFGDTVVVQGTDPCAALAVAELNDIVSKCAGKAFPTGGVVAAHRIFVGRSLVTVAPIFTSSRQFSVWSFRTETGVAVVTLLPVNRTSTSVTSFVVSYSAEIITSEIPSSAPAFSMVCGFVPP